jgi:hypothetical protein
MSLRSSSFYELLLLVLRFGGCISLYVISTQIYMHQKRITYLAVPLLRRLSFSRPYPTRRCSVRIGYSLQSSLLSQSPLRWWFVLLKRPLRLEDISLPIQLPSDHRLTSELAAFLLGRFCDSLDGFISIANLVNTVANDYYTY